ncbi:hypothetical protein ABL142_000456 [Salmonella enterica]|nr:hypothetical protein [Salmonella enterica]HAF4830327.1 hypothetical protein [Salmonella enterica]
MRKFNTKSSLKVDGKMSESGADKAGLLLARAAVIVARGVAIAPVLWAVLYGVAKVIEALHK